MHPTRSFTSRTSIAGSNRFACSLRSWESNEDSFKVPKFQSFKLATRRGLRPALSLGLLLALVRRVQNDRQRNRMLRLHEAVHDEAVAILRNVIGEQISGRNHASCVFLKQGHRRAAAEGTLSIDRHGGQHAAGCDVEEFFTVPPPTRLASASARDLPFAGGTRVACHINLPVAR